MDVVASSTPSISTCLLRPFYKLLSHYQLGDSGVVKEGRAHMPERRIPLEQAHALLQAAVQLTGDPDFGLKAGRLIDLADGGALAYATGTAPTVRQAIMVGARYIKLLNDAMDFRLVIAGARAFVHMDSSVPLPRASADFQASAMRVHHRRTHATEIPDIEWWFTHERPENTEEYQRTFGEASLRFSMPHFSYSFDARFLDVAQTTADARQHDALIKQMEAALAGIPRSSTLSDRVRTLILRQLPSGELNILVIAKELGVSRRTLTRHLAQEHTSFSDLVDDTRRRMALHYLEETDRSISSIAFLLGFSEVATFYRAFKRWTAGTPMRFRHAQRLGLAEHA